MNNLFPQLKQTLTPLQKDTDDNSERSRYQVNNPEGKRILIHNAPFICTCDANDKTQILRERSIVIENDTIIEVAPADTIKPEGFDLIYDAGKRGGTVITPGFINTHAHPPMYLLRSAMLLDEGEGVDETIAAMPGWEQAMTEEDLALSTVGELTEQQKYGITTTLSHHNVFQPIDFAAQLTQQNLINAISVASNARPENSPKLIEELIEKNKNSHSQLAIALHYLHKATPEILEKVKELSKKYNLLFTCHFAESELAAKTCEEKHQMSETEVLEKHGLLNSKTIASHVIHLTDEEIKKIVDNKVGIAHLPTSNVIHKSGVFPFWKFYDNNGFPYISLGTDSVISKSRQDLISGAYQTRIAHLYIRTVKFGSLFKMMTVNGARVLHMPDRSKIAPNYKADILFWKLRDRGFIPYDKNEPVTLIGNMITHGGRTVRDLMINGQFIIKNRKHQLVDETKLLSKLQEHHMEMRTRIEVEK